jgi:hypothetical protein
MFDFLSMMGNYEDRKVERDIVMIGPMECVIDTAAVSDSEHPYETGIACDKYNGGKWVIVEEYDTKETAKSGHARWVLKMQNNPPAKLDDVSTCDVVKFFGGLIGDDDECLLAS